jgi:hypothetical protein
LEVHYSRIEHYNEREKKDKKSSDRHDRLAASSSAYKRKKDTFKNIKARGSSGKQQTRKPGYSGSRAQEQGHEQKKETLGVEYRVSTEDEGK